MTLTAHFVIAVAVVVAILAFIARVKVVSRRAVQLEESGDRFEPKAEPTPSPLLRHFTLPQRTYLNQQFGGARFFFIALNYVLLVTAVIGLLPSQRDVLSTASYPQQVWAAYQDQLTVTGYVAEIFSFPIAMVAVTLLQSPYANFNRTRPVSLRFLFWGSAIPLLTSLLMATQAAVLASVLLLRIIYGPTWQIASVPLTFVFRLDLSMLTTSALIFSTIVFLAFLSRRWWLSGKSIFIPLLPGAVIAFQAIQIYRSPFTRSAARVLFLFPAQALPQSYSYALVPVGCVVALLLLAERLSTRFET